MNNQISLFDVPETEPEITKAPQDPIIPKTDSQETARRAKAEMISQRQQALIPDRVAIGKLIQAMHDIEFPECKDLDAQAIVDDIGVKLGLFQNELVDRMNKLGY